jgi:predicted HTH transcriptional regulator
MRVELAHAICRHLLIFFVKLRGRPGRLPNAITVARMRTGCRAARNQLLKEVMRDYGYLEHMGMGVPRKIIRGMKDHNGTDVELIEQEETFLVRLHSVSHGAAG